MEKRNLYGLTREELESFARDLGEPAFRGRQIYHWLYSRRVSEFAAMSDLSAGFRARLEEDAAAEPLKIARESSPSPDGARKFLFELADGLRVESVYLPDSPGETVCISSQVGCALGCTFCATGRMGLYRNLTAAEMLLQVLGVEAAAGTKLTNVVFMGMGEPLHNYDAMLKAARLLTDPDGIALTPRRVTVSTIGLVPMIERWIEDSPPAKIAISLHAPTDEQRASLLPVNRTYPLAALMKVLRKLSHATRYPVTFEYIMIADFNDRREDADRLRNLLRNIPAKMNLIRLHPTDSGLRPSSDAAIERFMGYLVENGIRCTLRASRGVEESAACGMLFTKEPFKPTKTRTWEG